MARSKYTHPHLHPKFTFCCLPHSESTCGLIHIITTTERETRNQSPTCCVIVLVCCLPLQGVSMPKINMLDVPNELRCIETILATSFLIKSNDEEEPETAISLIDIALMRAGDMAGELDQLEGKDNA